MILSNFFRHRTVMGILPFFLIGIKGICYHFFMKVLIVEDEKLTRSGLISSIDWTSLGIDEVLEASNGSEGIRLAIEAHPDIILTDMRMPRMDGVTMARKVRENLPDSAIIFMSGYSDKEYLKAAIDLKAVTYVEKPLDTSEVSDAIKRASEELIARGLAKRGLSASIRENEYRLAELMTRPPHDTFPGDTSLPETMGKDDHFTCILLKFSEAPASFDDGLTKLIEKRKFHEIHILKENLCLCFFLYSERPDRDSLLKLCADFREYASSSAVSYIALGDTFHGIKHAYDSYASAVVLLQGAFFCDPVSILKNSDEPAAAPPLVQDLAPAYLEALESGSSEMTSKVLEDILSQFSPPCRMLQSQVKDIYYQLFLTLQKAARQAQMPEMILKESQSIWDMIEAADSLSSLHRELQNLTDEFISSLAGRETESSMVFAIKEFIRQNYRNESLSIKSVSDHVNRSAPYVCTLFKNETGLTLNQYITGYRIEKAQELLADPRYKITDIATRVGYNDVNYFGKIFKKITDFSPSEFRNSLVNDRPRA